VLLLFKLDLLMSSFQIHFKIVASVLFWRTKRFCGLWFSAMVSWII